MIKIREATKKDIDTVYDLILEIAKFHNQEEYVITNKQEMLYFAMEKLPTDREDSFNNTYKQ